MSNDKKIRLIDKIIGDFYEYNDREEVKNGAPAMVTVIYTICTFGEEEDET